jgi:hypothetical protein
MMVSAKHSHYILDIPTIDGQQTLVFRDYRSYFLDSATAVFLTFTFAQSESSMFIAAAAHHAYNADQGAYVMDPTSVST